MPRYWRKAPRPIEPDHDIHGGVLRSWGEIHQVLSESEHHEDRELAAAIATFVANMPPSKALEHDPRGVTKASKHPARYPDREHGSK
jgi:hypothetical protein